MTSSAEYFIALPTFLQFGTCTCLRGFRRCQHRCKNPGYPPFRAYLYHTLFCISTHRINEKTTVFLLLGHERCPKAPVPSRPSAGRDGPLHSFHIPLPLPLEGNEKTKTSRKNAQFSHGTSSFSPLNYNIKAAAVNSAFEKIRSGGTIVFLQIDD